MTGVGLNDQVEAFFQWKEALINDIKLYQSWLQTNQLNSEDLDLKLQRSIQLLQDDSLTIAFAGEFSRGKTELINALFFAEFGQRMLPSQAGRTTMCPTELFFDAQGGNYLKLLPIATRKEDIALAELKLSTDRWVSFPLDVSSPDNMLQSFNQVARTVEVSFDEARALGFDVANLEKVTGNSSLCLVPAWRHALISLDNPVLKQGLRILDTPGLNALGTEPELTISMIPSAHAVIFLLGADTGVTASDMDMWTQFINTKTADHRAGRFAVMNKIDMFWDDLQGEQQAIAAIEKVRQKTAAQLDIKPEDVLLTSAKQALIAKVKGDQKLLERSQINQLERLLGEQILTKKEHLLTHTLVNDILGMLQTSQAILQARRVNFLDRLEECKQKGVSKDFVRSLSNKTQEDYDFYYKKLFTLRSSRRLMKSQANILGKLVNSEKFEDSAQKTHEKLVASWTTKGMGRTMSKFFEVMDNDMRNLKNEANLAQKMVNSIYERYADDAKARHLKPAGFNIGRPLRELAALRTRADKFRRNPSTVMSEQTVVVKRFFSTLVSEARRLYKEIEEETQSWPQEALLPLLQHTTEQKQLLERQINRLKELASTAKDNRSRVRSLQAYLKEINTQIQEAELLQRKLQSPPPFSMPVNVVKINGMAG